VQGTHPEIEFGIFLNEVGYANTPPFLGAMFHNGEGTGSGVAIVQGYVRNQGDGWTHASNHLDRVLAISPSADENSPEVPDAQSYLTLISTLGRRIAELHQALASPTADADFKAEEITKDDLTLWRDEALATATQAFALLREALPRLTAERRTEAEALLKREAECTRAVSNLVSGKFKGIKTRVHGDLHLGQVLVAQADWYVIDFEGEPAKDLATRRRKYPAMKDIAGMMRSFDYAAQAALQRAAVTEGVADAGNIARAQDWRDQSSAAFLSGYREVLGDGADADEAERLLQFYTLEKACYELSYESANRPDWIWIPVRGIAAVLDRLAS
jgi:maltose alpha-D-glucosyltransferase/alpha-amylase